MRIVILGLFILGAGFLGLAKEKLLIYTSVPIEIMTQIEKAFEAANPNIDLEIYRSGTGKVVAKLAAEMEAGKVQADLIWVADYSYFEQLKAMDMLQPYESPMAKDIPSMFVDKDHCYYAGRVMSMVIAYNTAFVSPDEAPKSWLDLLDPKWKGQVEMGNPQYSGAVKVAITALCLHYGLKFYEDLRANDVIVVKGNSKTAADIAAGAASVGVTLDYIVRKNKAQGSPIDLVYPEDGAVVIASPIGIIKGTEHLSAAQKFVDFVLSPEGQKAVVEYGSFIPVRPDVPGPEGAPELSKLKVLEIPLEVLLCLKDYCTDQFVKIVMEE